MEQKPAVGAPTAEMWECNVRGKDWQRTINHLTAGKARYEYLLDLRDAWPDATFSDITVRKVGPAHTSEAFRRTATYRGMPALTCGTRVEVCSGSQRALGVIVGPTPPMMFNVRPSSRASSSAAGGKQKGRMRELALFAGAGGGILAGELLGDTTVCAVERDRAAASVLVRRQNDGHLQPFPIWDDVRTFDGRAWRGAADVVSGGFPCQDISVAGSGYGLDGERSGLWREMARVVREVEPCFVRVENSPMLTARGLGTVLGDLAALGFDARWDVLSAADCGAFHLRERIWIVAAHPDRLRELQRQGCQQEGRRWARDRAGEAPAYLACERCGKGRAECDARQRVDEPDQCRCAIADAGRAGLPQPECQELRGARGRQEGRATSQRRGWPAEPGMVRMVHGVPDRVDRIKALGNAQVPRVAATAWEVLMTPNARANLTDTAR